MTDAIRELFEMLAKKENTGSDYTGTITRVDGNTAYVRFNGSDIDDTPVALSIGASEGDTVRVRVADGRAWLVGNDTAPPNDSSGVAYDLIRTNAYIRQLTTERIYGENGWINLLTATFDFGNGALSWNGERMNVKGAITATSGQIGPWNITSSAIYKVSSTWGSSTAGAAYFGNSGISITDKFKVDANGNATVSGTITAGANSVIGPWTVTATSIYYGNATYGNANGLYFGTSGLSLTDKFKVSSAGALTATGVDITGVITATSGKIGNWNISSASISATANNANTGNVDRTTGLQWPGSGVWAIAVGATNASSWATAPFRVNHKGDMYATSGKIGGWDIDAANLSISPTSTRYVTLSDGTNTNADVIVVRNGAGTSASPYTYPFHLRATGAMTCTNATITGSITATSGKIGPWFIRSGGISATNDDQYTGARLRTTEMVVMSGTAYTQVSSAGVLMDQGYANGKTVTMNMNGYSITGGDLDSVRFGHGTGSSQNVGIYDNTVRGWIIAHGSTNHTTVLPYYTPSDIRIKTEISRSKVKALDVLRQVDIVEFKRYGVYQPIGMISDWMEQLDPQFVGGGGYDEQGNMVIKYIDIFYLQGYLIKAIQELADKVSKLGG